MLDNGNLRPTVATVRRAHVEPDAGPQEEGTARRPIAVALCWSRAEGAKAQMVASWADEVVGRHLGRPTRSCLSRRNAWTFSGGRLKATFDHPNAYPGQITAQSAPTKLCTETAVFNVLFLKASAARTDFWGTPVATVAPAPQGASYAQGPVAIPPQGCGREPPITRRGLVLPREAMQRTRCASPRRCAYKGRCLGRGGHQVGRGMFHEHARATAPAGVVLGGARRSSGTSWRAYASAGILGIVEHAERVIRPRAGNVSRLVTPGRTARPARP
jgi:hypothetical protein